uniref:Uncharacterized protein n=1 Tax=Favella ehrenbergii TaxID=182087 RepID=A0A7S3MIW7_9SPIT|mmetsp:Transcript_13823/g.17505  ORF Transcript_13823/g.17505 Transcript_13823/m.17505 type:complete len:107 (+) Transcript_13823:459-779(+)
MFNMWAPDVHAHDEDWSKGRDDSTLPWYAKADWIEYHAWDPHTDTFHLEWRDEFDHLDHNRWSVPDNFGFDGNLSTYMASQVYVQDSQLVLKLDYAWRAHYHNFLQ